MALFFYSVFFLVSFILVFSKTLVPFFQHMPSTLTHETFPLLALSQAPFQRDRYKSFIFVKEFFRSFIIQQSTCICLKTNIPYYYITFIAIPC